MQICECRLISCAHDFRRCENDVYIEADMVVETITFGIQRYNRVLLCKDCYERHKAQVTSIVN